MCIKIKIKKSKLSKQVLESKKMVKTTIALKHKCYLWHNMFILEVFFYNFPTFCRMIYVNVSKRKKLYKHLNMGRRTSCFKLSIILCLKSLQTKKQFYTDLSLKVLVMSESCELNNSAFLWIDAPFPTRL